jgi:tetratricopeptide (TPR) repeat protein
MKKIVANFVQFASALSFCLLFTTASASAAFPVESSTADVLTRRGYVLVQAGDYKAAVVILKNALRMNPNSVNARRYLAYSLVQTGSYSDAAEQLQAISVVSPLLAYDYALSGNIDVRLGLNDEALQEYRKALVLEPTMPAARAGIVELFVLASDFQGATFLCSDCIAKSHNPSELVYFKRIADSIRAAQLLSVNQESSSKADAQMSAVSVSPVSCLFKRDLIPLLIKAPLPAPPKVSPIATKASA